MTTTTWVEKKMREANSFDLMIDNQGNGFFWPVR